MLQISEEKETFFTNYEEFRKSAGRRHPEWLRKRSAEGFSAFERVGFPTPHEEEWRFTNLAPLAKIPFRNAISGPSPLSPSELEEVTFGSWAGTRLVFVNGHYCDALSYVGKLPPRAYVGSLAEALVEHEALLSAHLGRLAGIREYPLAALNTAFAADGAFVYLPKGIILDGPIHLVFLGFAGSGPQANHPRNLIVTEKSTQAKIVETYLTGGNEVCFTNAVTEVVAGDNAILEHYKIQDENLDAFHMANLHYYLGRDSNVTSHSISLGGALVRHDLKLVLDGEGAEATLNGFYFVGGSQHVDNHTQIRHEKPHCTSHELYKGILDGKARAVFNGRIYVHQGAQKTDSKQTNKNLLLSNEALVNTNPQLEIYADDVKCTHGATIGQLDADSIFYLRSRGIGEQEARELLTYAFASDLTARISIAQIREGLERRLFHRFSPGRGEAGLL